MIALRWSVVILLLTGTCGTSAPSLSRVERERLPRDARQEIFDAENDVIIARNAKTRQKNVFAPCARRWTNSTSARVAAKSGCPHPPDGRRGCQPCARSPVLNRTILRRASTSRNPTQTWPSRKSSRPAPALTWSSNGSSCALARCHWLHSKDFEKAIETQEAKGKQRRASSLDLRSKVQARLDAWKAAQEGYASQTGDFDSGVWIE